MARTLAYLSSILSVSPCTKSRLVTVARANPCTETARILRLKWSDHIVISEQLCRLLEFMAERFSMELGDEFRSRRNDERRGS